MMEARLNPILYGHESLEAHILKLWQTNRLPHALLLTGQKGIGKATFAYRLARFLLSGGGASDALFGPQDLSIPDHSPLFQRIEQGGHGDIIVIEPEEGADMIKIDPVRKLQSFLSLTSSESPWRVVIIDSADQMNANAANSILKWLEEPPAQTVFLLVCHNLGAMLPTIRSRCQRLHFATPTTELFHRIISETLGETGDMVELYELADGSPGFAMALMASDAVKHYHAIIAALSSRDSHAVRRVAALMGEGKDKGGWALFCQLWEKLLYRIGLTISGLKPHPLSKEEDELLSLLANGMSPRALEQLEQQARGIINQTDRLHLERKQAIKSLMQAILPHLTVSAA